MFDKTLLLSRVLLFYILKPSLATGTIGDNGALIHTSVFSLAMSPVGNSVYTWTE